MWKRMSGNFKTSEDIQICGEMGVKSENTFWGEKSDINLGSLAVDDLIVDNLAVVDLNSEEEEYSAQPIKIKISSDEDFESTFLKIPGCVPIDVRACFRKLFPHSEKSSLKYYLKLCKLESKADMPFNEMWRIYVEAKEHPFKLTAQNMHKIANYCIIDALRYQELLAKRNVINDYREVAVLAYVSLFNTHY